MEVEEQQWGSALDRIVIKYRDGLTSDQTAALEKALLLMDKQELDDCLDSFVHGVMQESPAEWQLKMCLDNFLGGLEWFDEHFPEDLQLCHAVEALRVINRA